MKRPPRPIVVNGGETPILFTIGAYIGVLAAFPPRLLIIALCYRRIDLSYPFIRMPSSQGVQSFLAGAACSAALIYLYHKLATDRTRYYGRKEAGAAHPPPPSDKLLDSSSLEKRMIRKAEGALQKRTSRLIIVVERCTNDHVSCDGIVLLLFSLCIQY